MNGVQLGFHLSSFVVWTRCSGSSLRSWAATVPYASSSMYKSAGLSAVLSAGSTVVASLTMLEASYFSAPSATKMVLYSAEANRPLRSETEPYQCPATAKG